jgi:hypothetical protein
MNKLARRAAMIVLRPDISMELPGLGHLYSAAIPMIMSS